VSLPLFANQASQAYLVHAVAVDVSGSLHVLISEYSDVQHGMGKAHHLTHSDGGWLREESEPLRFNGMDTAKMAIDPITGTRHFAYMVEDRLIHLTCGL
jgi:hypothetical protein